MLAARQVQSRRQRKSRLPVPETPSTFICTHNKMLSVAPIGITNSDSALLRIYD
jgi:hypothetical protein